MGLFKKYIERFNSRQAQRYEEKLFNGDIRLKDVPDWLRLDHRYCYPIYIVAFRIDRGTSKEHFEEDLSNLEIDIELAKAMHNPQLVQLLMHIHELKSWDFEVSFPS